MRFQIILFFALSLFVSPVFGQEKKPKIKFGKISDEEMAMKNYAPDPGAPAVVLYDRAEFSHRFNDQGFTFEMERHIRIKIFSKEAYPLADVRIEHFDDEKILDLKASSYNMENGAMVETKISRENIFDEKLTRTRMVKKLTIPAVREGSIIELRYTRTNMAWDVPNWQFQRINVPTVWSEYKASVPSFIEFSKMASGEVPFLLAEEYKGSQTFNGLTYSTTDMHFVQENIPALKPEPFVNSLEDYLSQINFEVSAVYQPEIIAGGGAYSAKLVNGAIRERNNTWEHLGKDLLEGMYDDALKSDRFEAEANSCTAGKSTPAEKIAAIYEFIGKNYQASEYDMIWRSEYMVDMVKNRKGTPTDINLIFINMARKAKLNAFPLLVSTQEHGHILPFRVTTDAFNRLIAAIQINDSTYTLLDASAWPHPVGLLPSEVINGEGLLLRAKDDITWLPLQNKAIARSAVQADFSIDPSDGKILGPMTFSETGYGAVEARKKVKEKDAETYLKNKFSELVVDGNIKKPTLEGLENWQEMSIKGTFDLEASGFATISGNKIYLKPALSFGWKDNPFKDPQRKFNIELGYPKTNVYSITYKIPAGYKVEETPKGSKMTFGDNGLVFEYFIDTTPETVKVTVRRSIRNPYVSVEHYADLQQFFGNIVSKLEEQVVFTKI